MSLHLNKRFIIDLSSGIRCECVSFSYNAHIIKPSLHFGYLSHVKDIDRRDLSFPPLDDFWALNSTGFPLMWWPWGSETIRPKIHASLTCHVRFPRASLPSLPMAWHGGQFTYCVAVWSLQGTKKWVVANVCPSVSTRLRLLCSQIEGSFGHYYHSYMTCLI